MAFHKLQKSNPKDKYLRNRLIRVVHGLISMGLVKGILLFVELSGVIHLDDHHVISFKVGLGRGTNNKAELMALKLLLILSAEKGAQKLQIFDNSLVVVNWMNGTNSLENFNLQPIYEEIQLAQTAFNSLSFHHVYRERNMVADGLLKAGLLMEEGAWIIQEQVEGHSIEYHHTPFN
jgi:ribonuclease HI